MVITTDLSVINPDDMEEIAESIIPQMDRQTKTEYLAFRACGFGVRDACQLAGIHQRTVQLWRTNDEKFADAEVKCIDSLRQTLANEHINIRFTRNYALILEKDFLVIKKSLDSEPMSKSEHEYLLKARGHYTPQQMEVLKRLLSGRDNTDSFSELIIKLSRETSREEMTIRANREDKYEDTP